MDADPTTAEGIREYLKLGLYGLHQLVADRAKAAGKPDDGSITFAMKGRADLPREQRGLAEFVLFGAIVLDEFAQVWRITEGAPLAPGIADVVSMEDVRRLLPRVEYAMTPCVLAPVDKQCPVCEERWGPKTATDVVECRDELMHRGCARLVLERHMQDQYRSILERTPLACFPVSYVENGYWKKDDPPWVSVKTPWGAIVMGWRRHVINIDWSDTKCDVGDAFASEEVTKGPNMIHAYSLSRAAEYLTEVHARLIFDSSAGPPYKVNVAPRGSTR